MKKFKKRVDRGKACAYNSKSRQERQGKRDEKRAAAQEIFENIIAHENKASKERNETNNVDAKSIKSQESSKTDSNTLYREFDPGSGRTLAACLTHASRT